MLVSLGCEKKVQNGAHKVHFDRDMCARCKMVISDRNYVAQIVDTKKNKAYNFDDLGCAVIWNDHNSKEWQKNSVFYIADNKTGEFINIKDAHWSKGHTTPMDFGIAANKKISEKSFSFEEAKKIIYMVKKSRENGSMKMMSHE